jgi:aminoethylphosphonate catabolism LysR family transcriptional regulator
LLFNRHKKQVIVTAAGEKLLEITRRMFDNQDQARELLTESRATRAGTLRIVADSAQHVVKVLAAFRAKYPRVGVTISAGNTAAVIDSLYRYDADIGILGERPPNREFVAVALNSTPISAFVARGHPLAGRASLGFADLENLALVMREPGSRTRRRFEEAASAHGFTFTPDIVAEGREAVREIVAAGAGIGFVSVAEFGTDPRLIRIPLREEAEMMMDETMICLRERRSGKLVSAFLEIAQAQAPRP